MNCEQAKIASIIAGSKNIRFADMVNLVKGFGFELSWTDSSHTFSCGLWKSL